MKRILLTLVILFIGFNSYSQLKLDRYWVDSNVDSVIQKIVDNNENISKRILLPIHEFEDGYVATAVIFLDKDSNFLGYVPINKGAPYNGYTKLYGVEDMGLHIYDYKTKRKYVDFIVNYADNKSVIMFDDGSRITTIFEYEGRYRVYTNDSNTSKYSMHGKY